MPNDEKIQNKPQYFMVEVEALIPATLQYRVLADDAEDAIKKLNSGTLLQNPKLKIPLLKKMKAKVYKLGYRMILAEKKF